MSPYHPIQPFPCLLLSTFVSPPPFPCVWTCVMDELLQVFTLCSVFGSAMMTTNVVVMCFFSRCVLCRKTSLLWMIRRTQMMKIKCLTMMMKQNHSLPVNTVHLHLLMSHVKSLSLKSTLLVYLFQCNV